MKRKYEPLKNIVKHLPDEFLDEPVSSEQDTVIRQMAKDQNIVYVLAKHQFFSAKITKKDK